MHPLLQLGLSNALMALPLALLAALVGRLFRRPALTHALWLLVLIKLVTPPLVSLPLPWFSEDQAVVPPRRVDIARVVPTPMPTEPQPARAKQLPPLPDNQPEALEVPPPGALVRALPPPESVPAAPPQSGESATVASATPPWPLLIGLLWLVGSASWFGVALFRIGRFQQLLQHTQPAPAELQGEAEELARRMGRADCPQVRLLPGLLAPMLWSAGRGTYLLMPAALLERLDDEQRRTLLAHELAHWRRRDHWVRYLELVVLALYWWLPLAWWARRELREAEEECCDAWVVWLLPRAARAYATALVETLDFLARARPNLPPAASGMGQFNLLRRRLTMILRGTTPRSLQFAGVLVVGSLALLLLPLVPSFAQRGPVPGGDAPKTGDDLKKMLADLEGAQQRLDKQRQALVKQEKEVQDALQRLRDAEQGKAGGAADKRLVEVEKKLDLLLRELLELRQEVKQNRIPKGGGKGVGPNPRGFAPPLPPGGFKVNAVTPPAGPNRQKHDFPEPLRKE